MPSADPDPSPARRPVALETVIHAQLEKILGSSVFKTADSLRELLRFTVREALEGRGGEIKEYLLGATVLERGAAFDPKADPIVRVQMGRLREHLGRYYKAEGRFDKVFIDIPKGSYTPTFRPAAPEGTRRGPAVIDERLLVGRQTELTDLRAAFESAAAGQGGLFCLAGEPGIGKTTVVEAFLGALAASAVDCYVARGRCSERLAGTEAYLPVLEALESLLRGGGEPMRRLMSVVAPTWYAQIAPPTEDGAAGDILPQGRGGTQERLKRELVAFLEELAHRQPVVLFLDDLHWADASTIDVLAYSGSRCGSQRILIVGAYRAADLLATNHPFMGVKLELQGHGTCRETPMEFLMRADVDRYLALQFPGHLFAPEVSGRIHDRTAGNPLFMADLVRYLRDRGVFVQRDGRWVAERLTEIEQELPDSVRSLIQKKVGQLRATDHRLLVAASVQGYEFDSAVVAKALGADPAEVEERLEELDRVHSFVRLVSERAFPDRTLTLRYRFVHVLYQNALYASLRPTRKASLCAAVAETLLGYYGEQRTIIASELAMLFEAARDFERATEYFRLAAEQAAHVSAHREVVVLARRGLDALGLTPETPARAQQELRLQTILGPALMSTVGHGTADVEAVYVRARTLCQQAGETVQLFPVVWGLWQYWLGRAQLHTCRELGAQLLALADKLEDPGLRLMAHHSIGDTCWVSGDFAAARAHAEQVIRIYDPRQYHALASLYGGHDTGVANRGGLAVNLWVLGYPDQALQKSQEAIALARELSHTCSLGLALIFDAMVHQYRRDAQQARQQADAVVALATEQELAPWVAWGTTLRGWAMADQGEAEEGIAQLRQGIAGWRGTEGSLLTPYFLALLADAYVRMGSAQQGLATVAEALAITQQTHEGLAEAELYRLKGELTVEPAAAEACFHQAITLSHRQKAKSLELRAVTSLSRLYLKQGRPAAARGMLAETYGWFTEGFDTADLKEAAAVLERLSHEPDLGAGGNPYQSERPRRRRK